MAETILPLASELVQHGQRAFDAFVAAVTTSNSGFFVALMQPDVRFWVPLPFAAWRGEQHGADRVRELLAFERDQMRMRLTFTQTGLTQHGTTVGVEFRVAGENKGGAYHNHLCVFFDLTPDGQVAARALELLTSAEYDPRHVVHDLKP